MTNVPQPNSVQMMRILEDLNRRLNDLSDVVRAQRLNSSPTVRVVQEAIGTTCHAAAPAPAQERGKQVWH